ncbi:atp3 gamma subunit of the F1 sector of mitochondrial F1F0 ATP synthase [Marasmius crinis-equi]|uniref:ATP synthase subunit gamma n=1 Tax=Marasmius crinis-equi TaxID=585013 RepID=A0ABR3FBG3_9AGAR
MSMLARRSVARVVAQPSLLSTHTNARGMATLRELELRLKSVRNIEKITKSMKMIASTKLAKAQRAMQAGKQYGAANNEVFDHTKEDNESDKTRLFLVISSDKGLCGGIHSSVSKATRRALNNQAESPVSFQANPESPIMVVGDKSKAQLSRAQAKNLRLTFNQIGRDIPTFSDAASVADLITKSGVEFDSVVLVYNEFVSVLSYQAKAIEVKGPKALSESEGFKRYEMEDDFTRDLSEFSLANAVYAALVEGHACEMSARRNAMDNASKNAKDMIDSLSMQYNRGRQAAITNELVDIITGASAL